MNHLSVGARARKTLQRQSGEQNPDCLKLCKPSTALVNPQNMFNPHTRYTKKVLIVLPKPHIFVSV